MEADRGERTTATEPLAIGESSLHRPALNDLSLELAQKSEGFRRSLPASLAAPLATLVRSMNCYYSNLIEGRDTHRVDIERALRDDYSGDARKRELQLEARAHIAVQQWIDEGRLRGRALAADGGDPRCTAAEECPGWRTYRYQPWRGARVCWRSVTWRGGTTWMGAAR